MEINETKLVTYELAFVLKVGATDAELEQLVKAAPAEITLKGPVTPITLAYPIAKQTAGLFGFYQLTVPDSQVIKTLTDSLKHKDFLIRSLLVKVPKVKAASASRIKPAKPEAAAERKPATVIASSRIESMSNEKLEQTLEEILK